MRSENITYLLTDRYVLGHVTGLDGFYVSRFFELTCIVYTLWKIKIQRMQLLLQHRLVRLQKKAGSTGHRATKELPEKPQILHS